MIIINYQDKYLRSADVLEIVNWLKGLMGHAMLFETREMLIEVLNEAQAENPSYKYSEIMDLWIDNDGARMLQPHGEVPPINARKRCTYYPELYSGARARVATLYTKSGAVNIYSYNELDEVSYSRWVDMRRAKQYRREYNRAVREYNESLKQSAAHEWLFTMYLDNGSELRLKGVAETEQEAWEQVMTEKRSMIDERLNGSSIVGVEAEDLGASHPLPPHKYQVFPSQERGWWVCVDHPACLSVRWKSQDFDNTHEMKPVAYSHNTKDYSEEVLQRMADWLRMYNRDKVEPL